MISHFHSSLYYFLYNSSEALLESWLCLVSKVGFYLPWIATKNDVVYET